MTLKVIFELSEEGGFTVYVPTKTYAGRSFEAYDSSTSADQTLDAGAYFKTVTLDSGRVSSAALKHLSYIRMMIPGNSA